MRDRLGWETPEDPELRVSKERTLQHGYTWVPPGLSSEKVNLIQMNTIFLCDFTSEPGSFHFFLTISFSLEPIYTL